MTNACPSPTSSPSSSSISMALARLGRCDEFQFNDLFPLVYTSLRRIAGGMVRGGQRCSLQETVLVHETYLKLLQARQERWENRRHFFATAARSMRQVVIDHARRAGRIRRGGGMRREELDRELADGRSRPDYDYLALDEARERLEQQHPRAARVVDLRFYAGLSNQEVADALGVSTRTVERQWRFAQAWLARELGAA